MQRKGASSLGEARVLLLLAFTHCGTLWQTRLLSRCFHPRSNRLRLALALLCPLDSRVHANEGVQSCTWTNAVPIQNNHTNTRSNAMVHIERTWLFAAARIHLHEPFSLPHFDALCATLKHVHPTPALSSHAAGGGDDGATVYEALCEWLLEV